MKQPSILDKPLAEDPQFAAWYARQPRRHRVRTEPYPQPEPEQSAWGVWIAGALVVLALVIGFIALVGAF